MLTVISSQEAKSQEEKALEPQTKMEKLIAERKIARELQERRHLKWNEIYQLYRNIVQTNRLTQRQAVNVPLMKETVKTLLSRIDDPPTTDWKEKSGDKVKELIFQELWNTQFREGKFEWKDVIDKKNVLLYGISTKMLMPTDDGVDVEPLDPFDVVYDPNMNPIDIETARFIIRQNIFRSVREILADDKYTKEGKDALRIYALTPQATVQSNLNRDEWMKKMERLKSTGVNSDQFDRFAGGDTIINLTEHYTNEWNVKKKKFERRVVVYAQDSIDLMDESLMDTIGVDFWPFVLWSEDLETTDPYPDGVGDLVLTPNKILNVWFSQQVENRTLQNFNMHWFDSTIEGYKPQIFTPGPGVMLPAPGDPNKTIMPVNVGKTDETLVAMEFVTRLVERATGATAIEKGIGEGNQQTLGEVEILVGKAMERSITVAKFYRGSWEETAKKWEKLMFANPPKRTKLYKTGRSGKVYEKIVYASDWKSDAGYEPTVRSSSEQEEEQTKTIQKFAFLVQQYPNNRALVKIAQQRSLDFVDLTPDELKAVEEEEDKVREVAEQQQPQAQPQAQPAEAGIEQQVQQLAQMGVGGQGV